MKHVLVIDSAARTVTAECIPDTLEALQECVGGYIETGWQFPNGDVVFVNEEGLLQQPPGKDWFHIQGLYQPFVGNGVCIGHNEEGESVDVKTSLEDLQKLIRFVDINTIALVSHLNELKQAEFWYSLHKSPQGER